ncbi:MAG: hypothetical protein ACP5NZ_03840 [Nanobdellota archaeon]
MLKYKKAQVGETVTWIIATLILIVILIVFIFISSTLAKTKSLKVNLKADSEEKYDWINSKTDIAYSVNSASKNKIQGWISQTTEYG